MFYHIYIYIIVILTFFAIVQKTIVYQKNNMQEVSCIRSLGITTPISLIRFIALCHKAAVYGHTCCIAPWLCMRMS